jgi:large subunit ribosomal protein L22
MEAKAVARFVRITPRKAGQVADLIRGKDVEEAQTVLRFTPKAAAKIVKKVLDSAVANAQHNLKLRGDLYVSEALVNQGPSLKRIRPRAMGRAFRVLKRTSHITVVVAEKEEG